MKKILLCCLFALLGHTAALGHTVNVLILKNAAQVNFTFSKNFAVVIGNHYYGPLAPENQLRMEAASGGIRLTLHNPESDTRHSLGVAKEPVQLVASLGPGVSFHKVQHPPFLKKKPLPSFATVDMQQHSNDFVTLKQPAYGGSITYSGALTVYIKNKLNVVEMVNLEEYVKHVVNCELGGEKSLNALKAQSVMVRTFALYTIKQRLEAYAKGNPNWQFFQLFATTNDQAYNCRKRADGRELPSDLVKRAVKETTGEVLMKKDEISKVQYNTCASQTLPKGVICQEKMVNLARKGRSYKSVLSFFMPGHTVRKYNWSNFYTNTTKTFLKTALQK